MLAVVNKGKNVTVFIACDDSTRSSIEGGPYTYTVSNQSRSQSLLKAMEKTYINDSFRSLSLMNKSTQSRSVGFERPVDKYVNKTLACKVLYFCNLFY